MKYISIIIYFFIACIRGLTNRVLKHCYKHLMAKCGHSVHFSPLSSFFIYNNIIIGNNVYIGPKATFMATNSKIYIGNYVIFGPQVTIIGGDHNISEIGSYILNVKVKREHQDQDIFIEDDVWIGANVTILKGVTIGRGSIIGAGSVVTKSIPDYSISCGNPCHVIKYRWSINTILYHESLLYPQEKRKTREYIEKQRIIDNNNQPIHL